MKFLSIFKAFDTHLKTVLEAGLVALPLCQACNAADPNYSALPPNLHGPCADLGALMPLATSIQGETGFLPDATATQPSLMLDKLEPMFQRLDEGLRRVAEHFEYLREVSSGPDSAITPHTAEVARRAWVAVWEASGYALQTPVACTGPDGQLLYTWDRGAFHLELEIFPDAPAEFFYRNRESRELWSENYEVGEAIPSEAVQKIRLFI